MDKSLLQRGFSLVLTGVLWAWAFSGVWAQAPSVGGTDVARMNFAATLGGVNPTSVSIADPDFLLGPDTTRTYQSIKNTFAFELRTDTTTLPTAAFSLSVNFIVKLKRLGGLADTSFTDNVVFNYNPNKQSASDLRVFKTYLSTNALSMFDSIVSISPTGVGSVPPFKITAEINERRTSRFDCSAPVTIVYSPSRTVSGIYYGLQYSSATGDDYDVEWNFYERESDQFKKAVAAGLVVDSSEINSFRFNATRVTTGKISYQIPVLYRSGLINARVRAGHYRSDGTREFGQWTYVAPDTIANPHEPALNWQSEFTFAEEGKNIAQTKYFDGTLRERQSVTRSVANRTTLAMQTVYDFNGRAVVKTMPVPTLTDTVRYNNTLAMADSAVNFRIPFTKLLFDTLNACGAAPVAMSNKTCDATYYSPNNRNKVGLKDSLIPDAGGFHYTMTEFTPDATGRIRRQSGVGSVFRFGGGRETRYFYGKPSQEEIDRLFGTEVGDATHYQKNMVLDPNGQASVSYVDAHGRTVATALAGAPAPNTTKLSSLDSTRLYYNTPVVQNILNNVRKGDSLISSHSFLVPQPGSYRIQYNLSPPQYKPGCVPSNVCYNCQYELTVRVTASCADLLNGGSALVMQRRTFTTGATLFDTTCTAAAALTVDTTLYFSQVGEYVVSKSLSVYKPAADYLAGQFISQSSCKPTLASLQSAFESRVDSSGCNFSMCDSCKTLVSQSVFLTQYITKLKLDTTYLVTSADTAAALGSYARLKTECDQACSPYSECASILAMLTGDMNPGGQYGLYAIDSLNNFNCSDTTSIFYFNGTKYRYQTVRPYYNAAGLPDSVNINGANYAPDTLSPKDFITYWKPSWALTLVLFHPEYCYYQSCNSDAPCGTFDSRILDISTWAGALAAGVVDTNANFIGDSCFVTGAPRAAYKDSLNGWLGNLVRDPTVCAGLSVNNLLSLFVYNDATVGIGRAANSSDNDAAWILLRNFYVSYKYQLRSKWRMTACDSLTAGCVGNGQALCNGKMNYWKDKAKRVYNYDARNLITSLDSLKSQSTANSLSILSGCDSTCAATADQWMYKLAACHLSTSDSMTIRARLIAVCQGGCDSAHFFGASSVAPGMTSMTYHDTSFAQVITSVLGATGHTVCDSCNANLITYPAPYATPVYLGARNVWRKSDAACLYQNITNLEACYTVSPTKGNYANFAGWLGQFSEIPIAQRDVDTLKKYYNPTNTARWLPYQINLPPYLECSTCKTCDSVNAVKASFSCANTNDVAYWDKFARYANSKLGFILTGAEYYDFLTNKCAAGQPAACTGQIVLCPRSPNGYAPPDTSSCVSGIKSEADVQAKISYDATTDSLKNDFKANYANKCLEILDALTLTDTITEYHYTLYYYDQAGNLAKTVPPAGVTVLQPSQLAAVKTARAAGTSSVPAHGLLTQYVYNTLNKVTVQKSPDADTSRFWYDRIGRLAASQDGRQKPLNLYSYTGYDYLSRPVEVGEVIESAQMTDMIARSPINFGLWVSLGTRQYVTNTYYDGTKFTLTKPLGMDIQDNLRNRVASATFRSVYSATDSVYDYATHYSYDVTGNVKTLVQEVQELKTYNQQYKRIDYNYDQLSGKVNAVFYQKDSVDQFTHLYKYDEDNRLSAVYTSQQLAYYSKSSSLSMFWNTEASYNYYRHGPLARTAIGNSVVQGLDYAYTIQGWLKGMNADSLSGINDMGRDGDTTTAAKFIQPKDVAGYSISYFNGDYAPIGTTLFNKDLRSAGSAYLSASPGLFNGNIRAITVHNISLSDGKPIGYAYNYDQLHRLAAMDAWTAPTGANKSVWDATAAAADFQERVSYDANGNILKYRRNAAAGVLMDSLNYKYNAGTNQLQYVSDNVAAGAFPNDIDNQSVNNYGYDGAGNMTQDLSQGETIKWSPYGKVTDVTKAIPTTTKLFFGYDPIQHRVLKGVVSGADTIRTYYFHDAQGNTMGVYIRHNDSVFWREQYMYGSSRLGLYRADTLINKGLQSINKMYEGKRQYEISNHLGNVIAVVNDRRTDSLVGTVKRYGAVVVSASDYYPFGLGIDSRSYSSNVYRYGFNGKENDREWGIQDYGKRIYVPGLGKFLSLDPIARNYPELTPYQFASNRPIDGIDMDGEEYLNIKESMFEMQYGGVFLKMIYYEKFFGDKNDFTSGINEKGKPFLGSKREIQLLEFVPTTFHGLQPMNEVNLDPALSYSTSADPLGENAKSTQPGRRNIGTETAINPTGKVDGRQTKRMADWEQTARTSPDGFMAVTRGSAALGGVIEIYNLGSTLYNVYHTKVTDDKLDFQLSKIKDVIFDLGKAIRMNLIEDKFKNTNDLSLIGNFLLQGETAGMSNDLIKNAVKVFNEVTTYKIPIYREFQNGQIQFNTIYYKKYNDDGKEKKE